MTNNLPVVKQDSNVALSKTKSLINITNKILAQKKDLSLQDDSWIERLWTWADESRIEDLEWFENGDSYGFWSGLPRNKEKLLNLTELPLSGNQLITLPNEIGHLRSLTTCNFERNCLSELPNEMINLTNLTDLALGSNEFFELPIVIFMLKNLTALTLGRNDFLTLPKEIGNLTNLVDLDLSDTRLLQLPDEIVNLKNLKQLYIGFNDNLILTEEQKNWIKTLIQNGCEVEMDDDLMQRE